MKILQQNFHELFMDIPASEDELFEKIQTYMSMADPEWWSCCKPAPKEDIERLEKMLLERFGRGIPPSYRTYLELMGEEDGGLLSRQVDDLEFWNYFKGDNMAQGAVRHVEEIDKLRGLIERNTQKPFPIPPFWNYYYTMYTGEGWGFSPKTENPDQIVQADGVEDYFLTHDTFSQFLFYCAYETITNEIWENSTEFDQPIYKLSSEHQGTHCVYLSASSPREWNFPDPTLLMCFLEEIEAACSLQECWFSSQKELHLSNIDETDSERRYDLARYVGCQSFANLTVSMRFERSYEDTMIQVWIISQDADCTQWLVNEILKRTTLNEGSLTIRCID